jgi:flagellar hook-associated protein 3 FlgL
MIDRVSSNQVYRTGIGSILDAQSQLSRIQEQVASGKRIQNPSDDPTAAAEVIRLRTELNRVETYQRNADRAINALSFEESAIAGAESVLQRARELAVQGANDALLTQEDREIIASEIDGLRDSLLNIGNTRNADGEYIFAGDRVNSAAFSESGGAISYDGTGGPRMVNIAAGIRIQANDTGAELFQNAPAGNGAFEVSVPNSNVGNGTVGSTGYDNSYPGNENYTISFSTGGAGQLQYTVTGSTSGALAAAQDFTPGEAISFAGATVVIEGEPNASDTFAVTSGGTQSAFDTLSELSAALRTNGSSDATAKRVSRIGAAIQSIDANLGQFSKVRTDLGARLNRLDDQVSLNDSFNLQVERTISSLEDLDLAKAVTELNLQLVALQAAQQSYLKTQGISLFNYL